MLSDIIMACGNTTAQSTLVLSQNAQPVYFFVTWLMLTLLEIESVLVLI